MPPTPPPPDPSADAPADAMPDAPVTTPADPPIAHSAPEGGTEQTLVEHARNVAQLAAARAEAFGSADFAAWLGWWHDAGKIAPDVQDYLKGRTNRERGPDHSSAGMLKAHAACQPLAFNVAGHHGGLPDQDGLKSRVDEKKTTDRVTDALAEAEALFADLAPEAPTQFPAFLREGSPDEQKRRAEFWLRMLHSALVDADCLDTEEHFNRAKAAVRQAPAPSLAELWRRFEANQAALVRDAAPTAVNQMRAQVYDACLAAAARAPGLFSLSVPTGGGKTRSAMAFALRHALAHGKRRVVVTLPYTTIIEQNAAVYREIFAGAGGERAVLEHHSAVRAGDDAHEGDATERWRRMAAQNWDAPVVVTTTVQLFESLFASRTSRVRKLHNLAGSVLVLDEVQTLPPRLLDATLDVLQHLVEAYGVTVVLCTATQPAFASVRGPFKLKGVREIVPEPARLYRALRRVRYDVRLTAPHGARWTWDDVAEALEAEPQALVVLNTIRDAMAVLDALGRRTPLPQRSDVLHLSTQLCGAHRRGVLQEVKRRLKTGQPVRLVSTQVVEAGVDIDFPLALRALGPLDSIIQTAGRCNREGRREAGRVVVFEPAEGGMPPGAYETGTGITRTLLTGADGALDWHDPNLPRRYFDRLYEARDRDEAEVQRLRARLQFRATAAAYRLIDDDSTPVVVPYDPDPSAQALGAWPFDGLLREVEAKEFVARDDYRRLQPYMVTLRAWLFERAVARGLCTEVAPGLHRWHGAYDRHLRGLQWDAEHRADDLVW